MVKISKIKISAVICSVLLLASCSSTSSNIKNSDALLRMPEGTVVTDLNQSTVPQTEFDKAQTKLEMSIIQQTPTPIWVPPVVAKVLIMPYVDQNNILHSYQYAFEQLTPGKWLMGRYLANQGQDQEIIQRPLQTSGYESSKTEYPLQQNAQGMQRTPGVISNNQPSQQSQGSYPIAGTKENIAKTYNGENPNNSSASFFEGGNPKNTVDTTIPTGGSNSGSSANQRYFNNTLNAMKSGG
jgi:outer membrane murein-binding lipoprotein Lpp